MLLKLFKKFYNLNFVSNDAPTPWAYGFQDGASPSFEGIVELNFVWLSIIVYCILIINYLSICWKLRNCKIIFNKYTSIIEQSAGNLIFFNKGNLRDYTTKIKTITVNSNSKMLTTTSTLNTISYSLVV